MPSINALVNLRGHSRTHKNTATAMYECVIEAMIHQLRPFIQIQEPTYLTSSIVTSTIGDYVTSVINTTPLHINVVLRNNGTITLVDIFKRYSIPESTPFRVSPSALLKICNNLSARKISSLDSVKRNLASLLHKEIDHRA